MSLQLTGKITEIRPREQKSDKFTMRTFSMQTIDRFPQPIEFQLTQDRCDIIDQFDEGSVVNVYFDVQGSVWQDRIINNLNVWKIEKV